MLMVSVKRSCWPLAWVLAGLLTRSVSSARIGSSEGQIIGDQPEASGYFDVTDDQFNRDCLDWHNYFRSLHGAGNLEIDEKAMEVAKSQAEHVSRHGLSATAERYGYGINKFYGSSPNLTRCETPVKVWHKTSGKYQYSAPKYSTEAGTFTQMVWKSTTVLGCARSARQRTDESKWWDVYVVCAYDPPGNVHGAYERNVFPNQAKLAYGISIL